MVMKFLKKFIIWNIWFLGLISLTLHLSGQESEAEPAAIEPYLEFAYWKNTMDQRVLKAKMTHFTEIFQVPLEGMIIKFYTDEADPRLIGEATTNKNGLAEFIISDSINVPIGDDNNMFFAAEFEGNENTDPASESVWVQDVTMEMILEQTDGERFVHLTAATIVDDDTIPVTDEDVFVYVPRMFSDLLVGEGYFEDGDASVEFPNDIPGDSIGKLTIMARFDDHYLFGNVQKREVAQWGIPSYHEGPGDVRALWTQVAPRWMIVTLTILLLGVWSHYAYAVIQIFRIHREGKKANTEISS
jgi:hypothetical protein